MEMKLYCIIWNFPFSFLVIVILDQQICWRDIIFNIYKFFYETSVEAGFIRVSPYLSSSMATAWNCSVPWFSNKVTVKNISCSERHWLRGARVSPPAQAGSSPPLFLKTFPFSRTLSSLLFLGGDDWASGGAICPVFAQPFAGDERILQVCPPLLFPFAVQDGAPQTLTKLFIFGSESSYNISPTNFDFVCKNYRVYIVYTHVQCCVRPCSQWCQLCLSDI